MGWVAKAILLPIAVAAVIALALLVSGGGGDAAAARPQLAVLRIHSETRYVVRESRMWPLSDRTHEPVVRGAGTGFLVEDGQRLVVVTAAHVVAGPRSPTRITVGTSEQIALDGSRYQLESAGFRVRVSGLSLHPHTVYLDRARDVAVLTLGDDDRQRLDEWRRHRLADRPAQVGEAVRAWGFPGESLPVSTGSRVATIRGGFFTLNGPLEPGFSGGPVLDSDGRAAGVVSRSTERQARCASLDVVAGALRESRPAGRVYEDEMAPW